MNLLLDSIKIIVYFYKVERWEWMCWD